MVVLEDTLGTRQRDTRGRSKKKATYCTTRSTMMCPRRLDDLAPTAITVLRQQHRGRRRSPREHGRTGTRRGRTGHAFRVPGSEPDRSLLRRGLGMRRVIELGNRGRRGDSRVRRVCSALPRAQGGLWVVLVRGRMHGVGGGSREFVRGAAEVGRVECGRSVVRVITRFRCLWGILWAGRERQPCVNSKGVPGAHCRARS